MNKLAVRQRERGKHIDRLTKKQSDTRVNTHTDRLREIKTDN